MEEAWSCLLAADFPVCYFDDLSSRFFVVGDHVSIPLPLNPFSEKPLHRNPLVPVLVASNGDHLFLVALNVNLFLVLYSLSIHQPRLPVTTPSLWSIPSLLLLHYTTGRFHSHHKLPQFPPNHLLGDENILIRLSIVDGESQAKEIGKDGCRARLGLDYGCAGVEGDGEKIGSCDLGRMLVGGCQLVDVRSKMGCKGCGNGCDGRDKVVSCDCSRIGAQADGGHVSRLHHRDGSIASRHRSLGRHSERVFNLPTYVPVNSTPALTQVQALRRPAP